MRLEELTEGGVKGEELKGRRRTRKRGRRKGKEEEEEEAEKKEKKETMISVIGSKRLIPRAFGFPVSPQRSMHTHPHTYR